MEFELVWLKVCAINPDLAPGKKVVITEENLRKLLLFAYKQGKRSQSGKESWLFDSLFGN